MPLVTPTDSNIFAALRAFLAGILPSGNAAFTGYLAGPTLTVASMKAGVINVGDSVLGVQVVSGQRIAALGTGTGGVGTYTLSSAQTVGTADIPILMSTGTEVIQAQDNRVSEPIAGDFVTMTPLRRQRLATNVDSYLDCKFTASIAGTTMTVSAISSGTIAVGDNVFGVAMAAGTLVTARGTGTGGVGTYTVSPGQTVGSRTLSAGTMANLQPTMVVMQLDVHGPNGADNAQIIATMLRDEYAVRQFEASGFDVTPLYTEDPRQAPFINAEQQYENRWVVEAALQVNQVVSGLPQQFADAAVVGLVDVPVVYPL